MKNKQKPRVENPDYWFPKIGDWITRKGSRGGTPEEVLDNHAYYNGAKIPGYFRLRLSTVSEEEVLREYRPALLQDFAVEIPGHGKAYFVQYSSAITAHIFPSIKSKYLRDTYSIVFSEKHPFLYWLFDRGKRDIVIMPQKLWEDVFNKGLK